MLIEFMFLRGLKQRSWKSYFRKHKNYVIGPGKIFKTFSIQFI